MSTVVKQCIHWTIYCNINYYLQPIVHCKQQMHQSTFLIPAVRYFIFGNYYIFITEINGHKPKYFYNRVSIVVQRGYLLQNYSCIKRVHMAIYGSG